MERQRGVKADLAAKKHTDSCTARPKHESILLSQAEMPVGSMELSDLLIHTGADLVPKRQTSSTATTE